MVGSIDPRKPKDMNYRQESTSHLNTPSPASFITANLDTDDSSNSNVNIEDSSVSAVAGPTITHLSTLATDSTDYSGVFDSPEIYLQPTKNVTEDHTKRITVPRVHEQLVRQRACSLGSKVANIDISKDVDAWKKIASDRIASDRIDSPSEFVTNHLSASSYTISQPHHSCSNPHLNFQDASDITSHCLPKRLNDRRDQGETPDKTSPAVPENKTNSHRNLHSPLHSPSHSTRNSIDQQQQQQQQHHHHQYSRASKDTNVTHQSESHTTSLLSRHKIVPPSKLLTSMQPPKVIQQKSSNTMQTSTSYKSDSASSRSNRHSSLSSTNSTGGSTSHKIHEVLEKKIDSSTTLNSAGKILESPFSLVKKLGTSVMHPPSSPHHQHSSEPQHLSESQPYYHHHHHHHSHDDSTKFLTATAHHETSFTSMSNISPKTSLEREETVSRSSLHREEVSPRSSLHKDSRRSSLHKEKVNSRKSSLHKEKTESRRSSMHKDKTSTPKSSLHEAVSSPSSHSKDLPHTNKDEILQSKPHRSISRETTISPSNSFTDNRESTIVTSSTHQGNTIDTRRSSLDTRRNSINIHRNSIDSTLLDAKTPSPKSRRPSYVSENSINTNPSIHYCVEETNYPNDSTNEYILTPSNYPILDTLTCSTPEGHSLISSPTSVKKISSDTSYFSSVPSDSLEIKEHSHLNQVSEETSINRGATSNIEHLTDQNSHDTNMHNNDIGSESSQDDKDPILTSNNVTKSTHGLHGMRRRSYERKRDSFKTLAEEPPISNLQHNRKVSFSLSNTDEENSLQQAHKNYAKNHLLETTMDKPDSYNNTDRNVQIIEPSKQESSKYSHGHKTSDHDRHANPHFRKTQSITNAKSLVEYEKKKVDQFLAHSHRTSSNESKDHELLTDKRRHSLAPIFNNTISDAIQKTTSFVINNPVHARLSDHQSTMNNGLFHHENSSKNYHDKSSEDDSLIHFRFNISRHDSDSSYATANNDSESFVDSIDTTSSQDQHNANFKGLVNILPKSRIKSIVNRETSTSRLPDIENASHLSTHSSRVKTDSIHSSFSGNSSEMNDKFYESQQNLFSGHYTNFTPENKKLIENGKLPKDDSLSPNASPVLGPTNQKYFDSDLMLEELSDDEFFSQDEDDSQIDQKTDNAEFAYENYFRDVSDVDPKKRYAIRIFKSEQVYTTISCYPTITVQDMIPIIKSKFRLESDEKFQLSLRVAKISKILKPTAKPILIERKLLLLNGFRKTDPLNILGMEDMSFVFRFEFHPALLSYRISEKERRMLRSDFTQVNLRTLNLITPPIIFFEHCPEIETIDVSNNPNILLPSSFVKAAIKLSSLRMVNIRASHFPPNITEARKLVSLELQRNFIKTVPESIKNFTTLTILNLQCNKLENLPDTFSSLQTLQLLDLSSNRFIDYPSVINDCRNLLQLDLSYNKIHSIPQSINQLTKLVKLNLRNNKIHEVGDLSKLNNLRTINLRNNRIVNVESNAPHVQNIVLIGNRISFFKDTLPNLKSLELQENPITSIAYKDYYTNNMTSLSLAKAKLASVPGELFTKLTNLEKLDLSDNNLNRLPQEISSLTRLVYLSASRNKLDGLPVGFSNLTSLKSLDLHSNNIRNFVLGIEQIELNYINISSNAFGDLVLENPFFQETCGKRTKLSESLMFFIAADNQFDDRVWDMINTFTNLKVLNLSYNNFTDISYLRLENLTDFYFSGNSTTNIPGEIVLKWKSLKTLMLNGNLLTSLPSEVSELSELNVIDIGSNKLKYNISNFRYDWNWRHNKQLKYLNFSGNTKFEIKSWKNPETHKDLSDLTCLPKLRILGLMDTTLNTNKVPDDSSNFRVRTTASRINELGYGVADTLGHNNSVCTRDVIFSRFRGKDNEILICMHDSKGQGNATENNVSSIVKNIYDKILIHELEKCKDDDDGIQKALRLSFLLLNKQINVMLNSVDQGDKVENLTSVDVLSGACSTVIYIKGERMFTANIGDCMAILSKNNGEYKQLTTLHVPYKRDEYERIRISGGYVKDNRLDASVDVSRAVGFFDLLPHIHASPDISVHKISSVDDMVIIATKQLWDYVDYQTVCDIAREKNGNPLVAAEEMKDLAIAYGCSENLTIMCLNLKKDVERCFKHEGRSSVNIRKTIVEDAALRRLQPEISPPTGDVAVIFTDIKSSTFLWELFPNAMRTAIKTHNDIMRRQLRIYGGYEVKTEGDAFMVTFPTLLSGFIWCLSVQLKLLDAQWPDEITSINNGRMIIDKNGVKIYEGLSVRMGIHWGRPVPELDLVTQRTDYLGPVVNKAARVSGVADGGQITLSSDFVSEFNKILERHLKVVIKGFEISKEHDTIDNSLKEEKEIEILENIGWSFFDYGEKQLKGLENKEFITIAYPRKLATRHEYDMAAEKNEKIDMTLLVRLHVLANKLESIISAVSGGMIDIQERVNKTGPSEFDQRIQSAILNTVGEQDITSFFDRVVTRIEASTVLLQLRQYNSKGLEICSTNSLSCPIETKIFDIVDKLLEN
ncbi:hypothetical protein TBLA_0C06140 [Henningerozyma blattae CBS 6284]|uniref:Adenylate cyclase n=1 Tax=Henningerozyma blattae (strain ATCC 34711 / CBS 6284 / DSM 70876 / NBRC 10599 / NRRL Y-10934 / UCD 77-7) TaxID=1071380 RepID=I2H208_HENB6|nr:hypothetical protein TBLA_0C06140 [Tetrapisispora blattae CBS 6284]CCH60410.1 hypothetical protein TBLA_0C06140 [Tetrapisispora blattae CBS 6284]